MKKISDERINYISGGITYQSYDRNIYFGRAVAQAQLDEDRKEMEEIFDWGDETCKEHELSNYAKRKRECKYCWQALKQKHLED